MVVQGHGGRKGRCGEKKYWICPISIQKSGQLLEPNKFGLGKLLLANPHRPVGSHRQIRVGTVFTWLQGPSHLLRNVSAHPCERCLALHVTKLCYDVFSDSFESEHSLAPTDDSTEIKHVKDGPGACFLS